MEENQHISNLFQRIRMRLGKQLLDRATVVQIILSETKVKVPEEKINYNKRVVSLSVSPLARNEIFIKKEIILERIKKETGLDIKDIR